jgi:glycosyltransferase involved in cell wall biosynthesis
MSQRSTRAAALGFCADTALFAIQAAAEALTTRPDIIYTRDQWVARMVWRLLPSLRRRIAVEVHETSHDPRRRRQLAQFSRVVTVTRAMRDELVSDGLEHDRIFVAPDGVDLARWQLDLSPWGARQRLGLPERRRIAGFIGKFHTNGNEKGIPEIVQAAGKLTHRYPDLDFLFVGGPLDREPGYRAMAERAGVPQERLIFREKVPVSEVPVWQRACDVLLMPHGPSRFYETCVSPLKMFEYMAAQRPIVASDLPAIREVLTHERTALLGPPGDPEAVAANVSLLLDDPTTAAGIVERAHQAVQAYGWTERSRRILEFLDVLRGSRAERTAPDGVAPSDVLAP